ncbi:MAG: carboxypeptidase-like regulatory domain-containing protein, partial [Bacteroidia bacterium]
IVITLFAFLLLTFSANAQYSIEGKILDTKKIGVPYASIALSSAVDTSVIQFNIAKEDGAFQMKNVPSGNYILVIACVGYDVEHISIDVKDQNLTQNVTLTSGAVSMKEVMVRAKKIPILMNGDTVIYNSSSFKTQANANVEDLIKKLPGVSVNSDGSLVSEGEQITKVLINGKEFFGGNVEAATKNLDAELVDKIEVIDKKKDEDEFTEDDNTETEKVINLVLKEEHAQGYFGNIRAGYGADDIHDLHGNINFFRDATQLSVIGGVNNIGKRLYGWRDMQNLNSFAINPMNNWNRMTMWNSGVSTNKGVGANLHFEPVKGVKADFSYVITDVETVDTNKNNSEIYLPENTLFSNSLANSLNISQNHQLNGKVQFEPDTLNRIVARFQTENMTSGNLNASQILTFLNSPEAVLNSGVTRDDTENKNDKLATKIHWTKKNKKNTKNHFLNSFYYGTSSSNQDRGSYFNTVENSLLPFPIDEAPLINTALRTDETTMATTSGFQYRINEKWTIRPGFNWMGSDYNHSFDWTPQNEDAIASNSPHGNVRFDNMEYYAHFIYKLDSFTTIRVVPEINQMVEHRSFTTDTLHEFSINQYYFIPYIFVHSRKPHKHSFYSSIRANVKRPQTNQILPVTDNTNPYATIIGNIELKNFMEYTGYMNYRKIFGLGKFININSWNTYTVNPVISKTTVDENNYSTRELLNYKHRIQSNQSLSFNWPIKLLKATSNLDLSYSYGESYNIQNGEELASINNTYSTGLGLQWNQFKKTSYELRYSIGSNTGKIGGIENNGFISQNVAAEFVWNPIKNLEWSTNLNLQMYSGSETVPAQNIPIVSS